MIHLFNGIPGITVLNFMDQTDLVKITENAGVFILPSRLDQWGVVVHEFASAGMPLILSENVGSAPIFLIEKFNGLIFRNNSPNDLARVMHLISSETDGKLVEMGKRSSLLAGRITPKIVAESFLSILK